MARWSRVQIVLPLIVGTSRGSFLGSDFAVLLRGEPDHCEKCTIFKQSHILCVSFPFGWSRRPPTPPSSLCRMTPCRCPKGPPISLLTGIKIISNPSWSVRAGTSLLAKKCWYVLDYSRTRCVCPSEMWWLKNFMCQSISRECTCRDVRLQLPLSSETSGLMWNTQLKQDIEILECVFIRFFEIRLLSFKSSHCAVYILNNLQN